MIPVDIVLDADYMKERHRRAVLPSGRRGPAARPPIAGSQIAVFFVWSFILWGFLIGIFAVWLYAAMGPRYGAGPKTALCGGSFVWSLGYLLTSVTPFLLNLYPRRIFAIGHTVGLVEALLATLVGAW
jgi:hypothetical protein